VAFDSFGRSKGVRSLGSSEPELLLRRMFDAPFNRSLCGGIVVVLDVPLTLVARTSVGIGVRGLPTYIVDHESASGMDEWLARRGRVHDCSSRDLKLSFFIEGFYCHTTLRI